MGKMEITPVLKQFFAGKKVLITGHTGFKGSWLGLWLSELGAEVTGLALPPLRPDDHFNLLQLDKKLTHVTGDIRDYSAVEKVFSKCRPEIVFHLAAQALVRRSYNEPKLTFDTNIGGSVNILEAIRQTPGIRAVVYITSDKCYHNKEWDRGYCETDELGGDDPYSASKAAAEIVFHAYLKSFFASRPELGIASARAGNVIGGGDWSEDRIVPDAIKALRDKKKIILRNPDSTRPWQHVLEPLSGYLKLAQELHKDPRSFSSSWNFGPTEGSIKTVQDLARKIVLVWGSGDITVQRQEKAVPEAGLLHLNCDKANQELGWFPRWGFDRGVEKTVQWYQKVINGEPALKVTSTHIQEYMEAQP